MKQSVQKELKVQERLHRLDEPHKWRTVYPRVNAPTNNDGRPMFPVKREFLNVSVHNNALALELLVCGAVEREEYLRSKR